MIQGLGRLLGKSAAVTGAASAPGRATAELFAREGAHLTATDIQGEPLLALNDEVRRGGAGGRDGHRRRLDRSGRAADD